MKTRNLSEEIERLGQELSLKDLQLFTLFRLNLLYVLKLLSNLTKKNKRGETN